MSRKRRYAAPGFRRALPRAAAAVVLAAILAPILAPGSVRAAVDPVAVFIAEADSTARAGGDSALALYVAEYRLRVGAAVGQLLDTAIELGDGGDRNAETENIEFAARLGVLYERATGSRSPSRLVDTYRSWSSEERALRRDAKGLERQSNDSRKNGDLENAAGFLREALAVYGRIGDERSIAVVWGSLGVVHWTAGDIDSAAASYDRALAARRGIEDRILEGRTLNGLGSTYFQKGDFPKAAELYRRAADLRRATGDLGGLATSLTYLGNAYSQLGRLVDARESYEESYRILETEGTGAQRFELLNSIANLNSDMGRLDGANDAYEKALAIAIEDGDLLQQMICRNNLALNLAAQYRYNGALEELKRVQGLLAQNPDPEQSIAFHRNSGIIYLNMGELELARDHFVVFLKASEESAAPLHQIEALINLGYLLQHFGDYERGLSYAGRAAAVAAETGQPRLLREPAILSAQLLWLLGRSDESIASWERAIEIDTEHGAGIDVAIDRMGMANVLATVGRTKEAKTMFDEARTVVEGSGDGDLRLALYFGLGHAFEKTEPDSARHYYERALAIIESTRASIGGAEVRTGYLGGVRRYYYEEVARYYASLAKDRGDWSPLAFVTIERAKARGLLDIMESSAPAGESAQEAAVLDSIYRLAPGAPDYAARKRALTDRYIELTQKRVGESLGGLARGGVASIEDVRRALPKKTVMLAYALGDSASLLWVVDRDGHDLFELPGRGAIRPDVERLRDSLSKPGAGDAALRSAARRLYQILVAPARESLEGARRIVVVPDGFLFEMPFETLLTEDVSPEALWTDLPYLARQAPTVYAPSASVYVALESSKDTGRFDAEIVAVGDPEFAAPGPVASVRGPKLDRLPATRNEVLEITAPLDDSRKVVLLGARANEAELKRALRERTPRIVHLATHGLVDALEPAQSSIALSPDSAAGEDGFLHTLEILSLSLRCELVVLSACESARGKVSRGEGVVGLSRSFLASGARGTVASLWAVSDESTALLMKDFYARMLGKKKGAGEALNDARFELMKEPEFSHPYFWSPFVVIGSNRSPW
jgi:CHAT domain-containing protein/tetratricopeptide (TPR) repeat protein